MIAFLAPDVPTVLAPAQGLAEIANALNPLFEAAGDMMGLLIPVGFTFLALALVLETFSLVTQFWIKGGASDAVAAIFRMLLVTSIPFAMLTSWPELPNLLLGGFTSEITGVVTKHSGDAAAQISTSITNVSTAITKGMVNAQDPSGNVIVKALLDLLLAIVTFLPLVAFIVATLFALFGPLVLLYVGVIVGPLLVPWMAWRPMESLAQKWFSFMLSSGMAFVVGIIMATLVAKGFEKYGELIGNMANEGAVSGAMALVTGMIPMAGLLLFCGYLMLKCESIGSALVGGHAIGAGGGLFTAGARMAMRGGKGGGDKKPDSSSKDSSSSSGTGGGGTGGGTTGGSGGSSGGSAGQASLSQQAGAASGAGGGSGKATMMGGSPATTGKVGDPGAAAANAGGSGSAAAAMTDGSPVSTGKVGGSGAGAANDGALPGQAVNDARGPSRFAAMGKTAGSAAAATVDAARSVGSKAMKSQLGKAAVVSAAAAAAGPVGVVAAGAYAVSPKLREATGKAAGKLSGSLRGKDGGEDAPTA